MTDGKILKEKLFNEKKNGWKSVPDKEKNEIFEYSKGYIKFLNEGKTEREIVKEAKEMAMAKGFTNIAECNNLKCGDKIFYENREKSLYLAVIGEENIEQGVNIIGSHCDSPRLDLKPNPLYEDCEFAYFKTHYYGGIKKYQWTTIPLAIHGVIVKPNGETIKINIGEDSEDPIFTITDLLPHLAQEQMEKKLKDGINGEDLNLLIGSIPFEDKAVSEGVKLKLLNILNEKYGIVEADFLSSEIELVPAFKARSLGFDNGMVAGYGQDDRVCVYTSLTALLEIKKPKKTAVCIISDKEEIGSYGNTSMQSQEFDNFMMEILEKLKINKIGLLQKVFCNSKMLSADVDAGLDPIYNSVSEKNNAAYLGRGVAICKYTGAKGKSDSSEASAEFVAYIRNILEKNNINYQISEMGKVDIGGGGTIAYILANKGLDVIDCGIGVLSMHSPYEVTSKFDIYSAYKTYKVFWEI